MFLGNILKDRNFNVHGKEMKIKCLEKFGSE